jgi:hypothetical protein
MAGYERPLDTSLCCGCSSSLGRVPRSVHVGAVALGQWTSFLGNRSCDLAMGSNSRHPVAWYSHERSIVEDPAGPSTMDRCAGLFCIPGSGSHPKPIYLAPSSFIYGDVPMTDCRTR